MSKSLWFATFLALAGCGSFPSIQERANHAEQLAEQNGWTRIQIAAAPFELIAYTPIEREQGDSLTIFYEGDGFAWISESHPSSDPTPIDPIALRMALNHPRRNVAYLARPCQYVDAQIRECASRYWTNMRFAPEVIASASLATDSLKQLFGAHHLTLIGYSGGASIAGLLAAKRDDVERLITIAGVLDHQEWTSFQRIHPLIGSLNPADQISALDRIEQVHFVGGKDQIVPSKLIERFLNRFSNNSVPKTLYVFPDFGHRCCWAEEWPNLWQKIEDMSGTGSNTRVWTDHKIDKNPSKQYQ